MRSTSWIELSRSALQNNYEFLRETVGQNVVISSVVKGNAYGHGIEIFVPLAFDLGIRHFSVFSVDEAYRVLECCNPDEISVMIMGEVDDDSLHWCIDNGVEVFVFEMDRLKKCAEYAKKLGKKARVHIEAETGMNRTGFNKEELKSVKNLLASEKDFVEFKGLCTHYAGAESVANFLRVQQQIKTYNRVAKFFTNSGFNNFSRHTACSASMMMFPQTRMTMVRVGIMQYGFWPSPETFIRYLGNEPQKEDPLKRVMSWKSRVISTKEIQAGEFIGYGTSYIARESMKIAVIPVGYAHGFSRTLSNQGRILIKGQRVGVVGMVNMNMLSVDVTELENVCKGDEAVLIGEQGDINLSVSSFSEYSNQLNYEMLTRLPENIKRIITD